MINVKTVGLPNRNKGIMNGNGVYDLFLKKNCPNVIYKCLFIDIHPRANGDLDFIVSCYALAELIRPTTQKNIFPRSISLNVMSF